MEMMKIAEKDVKRILAEEISYMVGTLSAPEVVTTLPPLSVPGQSRTLESVLTTWLGRSRALQMWFHAAHHLVKGPTFSGDHTDLYERIYREITDNFDGDVEKAIGVTKCDDVACPCKHAEVAYSLLSSWQFPGVLTADALASTALTYVSEELCEIERMFQFLEMTGQMSLGLNDHLMQRANQYETFIYLLRRRAK